MRTVGSKRVLLGRRRRVSGQTGARIGRRGLLAGALAVSAPHLLLAGGRPSDRAGVVEVRITVRPALVKVDGSQTELLTYDGGFPGPVVRAKAGDLLRI